MIEAGTGLQTLILARDQRSFPESKCAMRLEGGHTTKNSLMKKMGKTPFQSFLDIGTACMHGLADIFQNGLCERSGIGDISVDARIFFSHSALLRDLFQGVFRDLEMQAADHVQGVAPDGDQAVGEMRLEGFG